MGVSCDICKYGCEHDYVRNNYYCSNKNSCHPIADSPIVKNCRYGEIDQWKYDFKYKSNKSDKNVSKKLMYEELKKILFGIKLKDIDTIMKEINELQDKITSYREPYKCETCAVDCRTGFVRLGNMESLEHIQGCSGNSGECARCEYGK